MSKTNKTCTARIIKMWLVHETTLQSLRKILRDGFIKPSGKTGKNRYDEDMEYVFMSVLFDDTEIVGMGGTVDVLLFFSLDIMKKYTPLHWTSTWAFGAFHDGTEKDYKGTDVSVKYDTSKSPEENAQVWHTRFRELHSKSKDYIFKIGGGQWNEVVFDQDIPISEIQHIYLNKSITPKFDVPKRVDTKQKLNKLIY